MTSLMRARKRHSCFSRGERDRNKSGKYTCAAISKLLLLNVCVYYFEDDAWSFRGRWTTKVAWIRTGTRTLSC